MNATTAYGVLAVLFFFVAVYCSISDAQDPMRKRGCADLFFTFAVAAAIVALFSWLSL